MTPHLFLIIDILGTFAFAVSGAFSAMEKKLDLFGVLILSFVTAIGGGTLRDLLIGATPVSWLKDETTSLVVLGAGLMALFLGRFLKKIPVSLLVFDALGLGLYTIIGMEKGIGVGLSPGICVALGTITGCFGGVIRDVLLNNIPLLFKKEIYASASIAGGIVYFILLKFPIDQTVVSIISMLIIFIIRLMAVRYNISLPRLGMRRND